MIFEDYDVTTQPKRIARDYSSRMSGRKRSSEATLSKHSPHLLATPSPTLEDPWGKKTNISLKEMPPMHGGRPMLAIYRLHLDQTTPNESDIESRLLLES